MTSRYSSTRTPYRPSDSTDCAKGGISSRDQTNRSDGYFVLVHEKDQQLASKREEKRNKFNVSGGSLPHFFPGGGGEHSLSVE